MSVCLGPRTRAPAPLAVVRPGPFRFGHVKAPPAPALARYVDHYWVTCWDRRGHPPRSATALLDPCIHLHVCDGRAEILGVVRGTYRMRLEGSGCVVGAKFRPGGFYPFVPRPASEWTDRVMPAQKVFDGAGGLQTAWARDLSDAAATCRGDAAAHAAVISTRLDAFLGALLGARVPARDLTAEHVVNLVALIAARADVRRVSDLVRASGRSERTLHRLFARYVGASPAWVIRRYRLHAAAERLTACPPADVRAVAWELGYADQAHFIRDFRATIGVTPGAYVHAAARH